MANILGAYLNRELRIAIIINRCAIAVGEVLTFVKFTINFLLNLLEKYFVFALWYVVEGGASVEDNVVHGYIQRLITKFGIK